MPDDTHLAGFGEAPLAGSNPTPYELAEHNFFRVFTVIPAASQTQARPERRTGLNHPSIKLLSVFRIHSGVHRPAYNQQRNSDFRWDMTKLTKPVVIWSGFSSKNRIHDSMSIPNKPDLRIRPRATALRFSLSQPLIPSLVDAVWTT
jgi:hypothetical protein